MDIQKITTKDIETNKELLNIQDDEIIAIHNKIIDSYEKYLRQYGVKPLWKKSKNPLQKRTNAEIIKSISSKELQLIFLYKHKGKMVHKDVISAFVRQHIPDAGLDQQVRHISSQKGWNVLNTGDKIPDEEIKIPLGFHYLVSLETPKPSVLATAIKRNGRLNAKTFDELKIVYNNKCATCGIEEGTKDKRMDVIVKLQQGHMNPRNDLTLDNTIPQCQYCNRTYSDYFCFNEHGHVVAVNNPHILLKSPRNIQDEMITVLLEERKKQETKTISKDRIRHAKSQKQS